jgi:hypothetical protein
MRHDQPQTCLSIEWNSVQGAGPLIRSGESHQREGRKRHLG